MANTFLTIKNIARMTLPRLMDNIVFPNLVHRDFSGDFQKLGDTIQIKKPLKLTATEFDASTGVSAQNMTEESVDVKLDKIATVDVAIEAIEGAVNMDEAKLQRDFIEPAAVALAEKINADGLALYADIPTAVGTQGDPPATLAEVVAINTRLNLQKVPMMGRNLLMDPYMQGDLLTIDNLVKANEAGSNAALRNAMLGRIFQMDSYMSQSVKSHTKGTLAAGGTTPKITVKTSVSDAAQVVLDVTASASGTLTGTLKKGDRITFAGDTTKYYVTELATAAANEITVKLSPNVTVLADVEVTVGANYVANLAFHPIAFAFVTRPMVAPSGVESYVTTDPMSGLTLRVVRGYDMKYKREMLSMDVLYGYKTIYPELAAVVFG
jgi:hypothetical protein